MSPEEKFNLITGSYFRYIYCPCTLMGEVQWVLLNGVFGSHCMLSYTLTCTTYIRLAGLTTSFGNCNLRIAHSHIPMHWTAWCMVDQPAELPQSTCTSVGTYTYKTAFYHNHVHRALQRKGKQKKRKWWRSKKLRGTNYKPFITHTTQQSLCFRN